MVATSYSASAPGNMMVLGEYAVTTGAPALIYPIKKHTCVTITPRKDNNIHIQSQLGTLQTTLETLSKTAPFEFVLSAIKLMQTQLTHGLNVVIQSDIVPGIGLSSSAAVTVATLRALHALLSQNASKETLLKEAITILHDVQGNGSGADMAASIYGTFIYYQNERVLEEFHCDPPFFAIYYGLKDKKSDSLKRIDLSQHQSTIEKISLITKKAFNTIKTEDWKTLGAHLNDAQLHMEQLGVNTPSLDCIIEACQIAPNVLGAKISGSGFGDCVIGLGEPPHTIDTLDIRGMS